MLGTKFTVSYHTAGTLAANHTFIFTAPFDMSLVAVSAVGSNANNGILDIGSSADTDLYLSNLDVGDSNVPATVSLPADFIGGVYPHILKGVVVEAELDYDGGSGTAVHDFTLVMTFSEG
jgi:hypothetical protein